MAYPRTGLTAVTLLLCMMVGPSPTLAQESPPPDVVVDLNQGIYLYLHQPPGEAMEGYQRAIDQFTRVLERDPENQIALLFRALSHGQIGLLHHIEKVRAEFDARELDGILDIRRKPDLLEERRATLAQLEDRLADVTLREVERTLTLIEKQRIEDLLDLIADYPEEEVSTEDLTAEVNQNRRRLHLAAQAEADAYGRMIDDVRRFMGLIDRPDHIIRLLEAVGISKIARIREGEAMRLLTHGDVLEDLASGPVDALRAEASKLLEQIADLLERVRRDEPQGLDALRTEFFLGVIRYRQAVPMRAENEAARIDEQMLAEARQLMRGIAENEETDPLWRSYAALYLGIIIPFEGSLAPTTQRRREAYLEAQDWIYRAIELDPTEVDDPTRSPVVRVAARQLEQIKDLLERVDELSVVTALRNDITLSLSSGLHHDTNVVLLGERADLPRGITDEEDSGFTSSFVIDYTVDLDEKWTLGMQGRVSGIWHCSIDEFDEELYGGSVAIQNEAIEEEGDFGPLYLRLQYDYEYTLLGRSAFLDFHSVTPNIRMFALDRQAEADVYFIYSNRDYHEPLNDRRLDRDGTYMTLGAIGQLKTVNMTEWYRERGVEPWGHPNDDQFSQDDPDYPNRYLEPFLGARYAWDDTDGEEFDQRGPGLTVGVTVPLPYGWFLDTVADFEWQDYRNPSLLDYHRRKRRDFIQQYGMALSRSFVLRGGQPQNRFRPDVDRVVMTVSGYMNYTDDDSNVVDRLGQAIFEYDRAIYGFSVAFSFN
jgi:tetratricopeptide (TPR) repeat protein